MSTGLSDHGAGQAVQDRWNTQATGVRAVAPILPGEMGRNQGLINRRDGVQGVSDFKMASAHILWT